VIEGQLFPYFPPIVERILAYLKYKTILEFDDAIYLTRFHKKKISALLRASSVTIVGNGTLARYARSYSTNVLIFPTVIDTTRFYPLTGGASPVKEITIGWIGLVYNFSYLCLLQHVMQRLQRNYPIRLRVISSRPPQLHGINVEFKPWSFEREVTDLQGCHIGVMPLPDDDWARGKCGLKLLQYMALGIPSVASPVGVNTEIIMEGMNGFLAASEDDWYVKLSRLCEDAELRMRIGMAGRRTVEERYSLRVWGPRLAEFYKEIANAVPKWQTIYSAV
jgi:glycosyltransferase involved in cell wall biosynthesis